MAVTYDKIATTTLGAAASVISFTSISGSYTDLVLVTQGTTSTGGKDYNLRFNSDSGTNYSFTILAGSGASASSGRGSNAGNTGLYVVAGTSSTVPDVVITHIMNYSNTTTYKTILQRGNEPGYDIAAGVSLWRSTSAITRVDIYASAGSANWKTGTTATLYGIKSA